MDLSIFIQTVTSGVLLGGLYGLIALGMTLIFGVMRIINLAHGEFLMIGMYVSYILFTKFGVDPYLSIVVSVPLLFVIGIAIQRFLLMPLIKAKAPGENQILMTAGIGLVLTNAALLIFSPNYFTVLTTYSNATASIGKISVSLPLLWDFLICFGITGILYLFIMKTDTGCSIRAVAQNIDSARLMGINIDKIMIITFGVGAALGGCGGNALHAHLLRLPGHRRTLYPQGLHRHGPRGNGKRPRRPGRRRDARHCGANRSLLHLHGLEGCARVCHLRVGIDLQTVRTGR